MRTKYSGVHELAEVGVAGSAAHGQGEGGGAVLQAASTSWGQERGASGEEANTGHRSMPTLRPGTRSTRGP